MYWVTHSHSHTNLFVTTETRNLFVRYIGYLRVQKGQSNPHDFCSSKYLKNEFII